MKYLGLRVTWFASVLQDEQNFFYKFELDIQAMSCNTSTLSA
jgi:hypothetical protein